MRRTWVGPCVIQQCEAGGVPNVKEPLRDCPRPGQAQSKAVGPSHAFQHGGVLASRRSSGRMPWGDRHCHGSRHGKHGSSSAGLSKPHVITVTHKTCHNRGTGVDVLNQDAR